MIISLGRRKVPFVISCMLGIVINKFVRKACKASKALAHLRQCYLQVSHNSASLASGK